MPNRREANCHVGVGDWVDDKGVPGDYNSRSPMSDKCTFPLAAAPMFPHRLPCMWTECIRE